MTYDDVTMLVFLALLGACYYLIKQDQDNWH